MKDYEGEIIKVNLHKRIAVVRTTFMGSTTDVHMGIEILQKRRINLKILIFLKINFKYSNILLI